MHLDLEEHDDPQRIFESLNSTGLELSEADKIRNLVLMGLPSATQNLLYEDYWNRMEKNVNYDTDAFLSLVSNHQDFQDTQIRTKSSTVSKSS